MSIQCQGGQSVVGSEVHRYFSWIQSLVAAMTGVVNHFSDGNHELFAQSQHWDELRPDQFPCQKTSSQNGCLGWVLGPGESFAAPGLALECPCALGRRLKFGPLFEMAFELSKNASEIQGFSPAPLKAFVASESRADFFQNVLSWLWVAKTKSFSPLQSAPEMNHLGQVHLSVEQKNTLRWWLRLMELSQLVSNEKFVIFLQSTLRKSFEKGHAKSHHDIIDQLKITNDKCIVLAMNKGPLTPPGFNSEKHAWLESFISAVDDRYLGVCIIGHQPLLEFDSAQNTRATADFRWRPSLRIKDDKCPLQHIVRRGTWDRLCEALARGEAHLNTMSEPQVSQRPGGRN